MRNLTSVFPTPIAIVAIVMAVIVIWIKYPAASLVDFSASAARLALAWILIPFAAFAIAYLTTSGNLESKRIRTASRIAWIVLVVLIASYGAPLL